MIQTGIVEIVLTMCAITMSGGWDCDKEWVVVQEDTLGVWDQTGIYRKGVAYYEPWRNSIYDTYPELHEKGGYGGKQWIHYGGQLGRDNCYNDHMTEEPTNCLPMIWHEIKHLQCQCNWHENMTATDQPFKGVFGGFQ